MASTPDKTVIFSADIDAAAYNRKLDEMVRSLDLAVQRELKMNDAMQKMQKTIDTQAAQFKGLNDQITQLNTKLAQLEDNQNKAGNGVGQFANKTATAAGTVGRFGGAINALSPIIGRVFGLSIAGLATAALGKLIKLLIDTNSQLSEFEKRQKIVNEITNKAASSMANSFSKLELVRQKLNDLNISQEQRIKLAKTYNDTADKANQIDITQIDNLGKINNAISSQIALLKERALVRASEAIVADRAEKLLLAQEAARLKAEEVQTNVEVTDQAQGLDNAKIGYRQPNGKIVYIGASEYTKRLNRQAAINARIAKDPAVIAATEELNRSLSVATGLIDIEAMFDLKDPKTKKPKAVKEAIKERVKELKTNLFKELAELNDDLAKQNVLNIRDDFERQEAELNRQYDKQREFILGKYKQVTDELKTRIPFIRNALQPIVERLFFGMIDANEEKRNNAQLDLRFKRFLDKIALLQESAEESDVQAAENAARQIDFNRKLFEAGKISYKDFQDSVTTILKRAAEERNAIRIDELNKELALVNTQIDGTTDPEQKRKLQDKQRNIRAALAKARSEIEKADGDDKESEKKIEIVSQYAQAIGELANSIVDFWQRTNEAEQRQLERSIGLQEKRVEAARRLAERGNAEYLQLEEERLNALQLKRENAARRELAINAVIQTSQALVAFTTALAQGLATGGPLGAIGIAAATIGLLASGYSIIKSLQEANSPQLYEGTKYLKRNGQPAGRDTIPALLNEGEAVIPTETNRQYKDAVDAIYDRAIPADELNTFVNMYKRGEVPKMDTARLESANQFFIAQDGRLYSSLAEQNRKMDENNRLMKVMVQSMKHMGVNVSLDRNGFAVSMMEAVKRMKIDKNT